MELNIPKAIACQLMVIDALGHPILEQALPKLDQQKIMIETQDWASGLYHLAILYQGRLVYSERLVLIK